MTGAAGCLALSASQTLRAVASIIAGVTIGASGCLAFSASKTLRAVASIRRRCRNGGRLGLLGVIGLQHLAEGGFDGRLGNRGRRGGGGCFAFSASSALRTIASSIAGRDHRRLGQPRLLGLKDFASDRLDAALGHGGLRGSLASSVVIMRRIIASRCCSAIMGVRPTGADAGRRRRGCRATAPRGGATVRRASWGARDRGLPALDAGRRSGDRRGRQTGGPPFLRSSFTRVTSCCGSNSFVDHAVAPDALHALVIDRLERAGEQQHGHVAQSRILLDVRRDRVAVHFGTSMSTRTMSGSRNRGTAPRAGRHSPTRHARPRARRSARPPAGW